MAQQGFEYERNTATFLKKHKLVKPSFQPAGAGHGRADLEVFYQKRTNFRSYIFYEQLFFILNFWIKSPSFPGRSIDVIFKYERTR